MILEIKLYHSKELLISSLKLNRTGKVLVLYKSTECKKKKWQEFNLDLTKPVCDIE